MKRELIILRHLRLELDMSYSEMGRGIGFKDPGLIHKLLNDKHNPTERSLYKIRRYLKRLRRKHPARVRVRTRRPVPAVDHVPAPVVAEPLAAPEASNA